MLVTIFFNLLLGFYAVLGRGVSTPVVDLGYAKYQGFLDASSKNTHFFGIRYAAPPLGALRFAAPKLPGRVAGVQSATSHPPMCPQSFPGASSTNPFKARSAENTEDCLFLDVYVPGSLEDCKGLPVIVWIHGGGYISGSATGYTGADVQNGDDLIIRSQAGVVVVVIQYRLGLFGFLAGSKVKKRGALNAGLLDQQFALTWVQKHISKFGGDPDRVTIWGHSAGAGSVIQHVIANNGRTYPPLFRTAMTSSAFLPSQYKYNDALPEQLYSQTVSMTNCSTALDSLECLRAVDTGVLQTVNAAINTQGFYQTFLFVPVIDGDLITRRPTELLKTGKINGKALYSVSNSGEGLYFINASTAETVQVEEYVSNLFPTMSPEQIRAAARVYAHVGTAYEQVVAIHGDAIVTCPTYSLLRAYKKRGPAYKSQFAIQPGTHAQDFPYYFISTGPPEYNNTDFIRTFAGAFVKMAETGDPRSKGSPTWKTWNGKNEIIFNKTEEGTAVIEPWSTPNDLMKRCAFWDSISAVIGH